MTEKLIFFEGSSNRALKQCLFENVCMGSSTATLRIVRNKLIGQRFAAYLCDESRKQAVVEDKGNGKWLMSIANYGYGLESFAEALKNEA